MELAPTYAFARLKKQVIKYEEYKLTIVYKNNKSELPEADTGGNSDDITTYMHGSPIYSFSSIGAKIGITLNF